MSDSQEISEITAGAIDGRTFEEVLRLGGHPWLVVHDSQKTADNRQAVGTDNHRFPTKNVDTAT